MLVKTRILLACFAFLFQLLPATSYAAFPLKQKNAPADTAAIVTDKLPASPVPPFGEHVNDGKGWGIAALATGIFSLVLLAGGIAVYAENENTGNGFLGIAILVGLIASTLGIYAINKPRRGVAIAGLALGALTASFAALLLLSFAMLS